MQTMLKKYINTWLPISTTLIAFGIFYLLGNTLPKDNTDPIDGRSGMSLHTDNKTGCQYLSLYFGGLTPRLDKSGQHVCGENNE